MSVMESRTEITSALELSDLQRQKVLLHSFYNILTVMQLELHMIKTSCESPKAFAKSVKVFGKLNQSIKNTHKTPEDMAVIENFHRDFSTAIEQDSQTCGALKPDSTNLFAESLNSLKRILGIIEIRVKEFIQACNLKNDWVKLTINELRSNIQDVFTAMAEHSHGRFGVCFSAQDQNPSAYFLNIEIKTPLEDKIYMPAFLHDVMRDLMANARKYSLPGTRIDAILENTGTEILLTVRDQGRGIPEAEIELVVEMGYRASNTTKDETNGEGFGLTKAYMICKKHNGRMWIDSAINSGTEITIAIPVP